MSSQIVVNARLITIIIIFILGLLYVCRTNKEGFRSTGCPDVLVQQGSTFNLFNSRKANIPGVNPIQFDNLNEYVEFTEWQRSQGIRCPVLYLQESYDIQNEPVYKVRPDPENTYGGAPDLKHNEEGITKLLDASRSNPPYNMNGFPAYDRDNQDIGNETPLDKMFKSSEKGNSINAMDTNWGGSEYARSMFPPMK
tara:strand:- start:7 stop:594 length:588 start_codon:yes stop_codon:yes gene_type:complete